MKKLLALSLSFAFMAFVLSITTNAQGSTASLHVTGTLTIYATGAYLNGLHFNTPAASFGTMGVQSTANSFVLNGGTNLEDGVDEIKVKSSKGGVSFTVYLLVDDFLENSAANSFDYYISSAVSLADVTVSLPEIDANGVSQDVDIDNFVGNINCELNTSDITFHNPSNLVSTNGLIPVWTYAPTPTTPSFSCIVFTIGTLIPINMEQSTVGLMAGNYSSVFTFTASSN